jgi:hypothetical protein
VWWALGMVTSGHPRVRDFEQLECTDYTLIRAMVGA